MYSTARIRTALILIAFFLRDGSLKTPGKKKGEVISDPVVLDQYIALSDFTKCGKGQISVVAGDVVEVIEKSDNGMKINSIP